MIITVLGGGNGAQSAAADLTLRGFEVNLCELPEFKQNFEAILEQGGIELVGAAGNGFAKISKVTTSIEDAIDGVDIIWLAVPAFGQDTFFEAFAPYLENGQKIVISPGNHGSLALRNMLDKLRIIKEVLIAETTTLVYACRIMKPGTVNIRAVKKTLPVAALPARDTEKIVSTLKLPYPQVIPAKNVLETSMNNINHVVHPTPALLNAGRIESTGGDFAFYIDGITQSVAKLLEIIDKERISVMQALGLKALSLQEYNATFFGVDGKSIYESMQKCRHILKSTKAPTNLQHRYITEDVPYGLVPIASLGEQLRIPTPATRTIIQLASLINQTDYFREGRNSEKLGLKGLNTQQIESYLSCGK